MNVFTFGSRLLRQTSPVGVIALAFPPTKQSHSIKMPPLN